jgi:uroporphyrinogen-III decarboxylase
MSTTRDRLTAVFKGGEPQKIVWWPRIKHWYDLNNSANTLPARYQGLYLDEIYRDLGVPPRQVWTGGLFGGGEYGGYINLSTREGSDIDVWVKPTKGLYYKDTPRNFIVTRYETPVGEMTQVVRRTERGTSIYPVEYYLKDQKSIEVYKYVLEQREYEFDWQYFRWGEKRYGDMIYPRAAMERAPLLRLVIDLMGLNKTVIWLWKYPEEMEELMELMLKDLEKQVEAYAGTPVIELSMSSNIHESLCSPIQFKKYMIPHLQRITEKIHAAGKYASAHWDGFVKTLLPLLRETGLDGVECVTPKPQGDVTLEEIKTHIIDQNKFLRDGIPAILFTGRYPIEELETFTRRILDYLGKSGRVQLGISDLLPANGDIERVRLVGEIVEEWNEENFG